MTNVDNNDVCIKALVSTIGLTHQTLFVCIIHIMVRISLSFLSVASAFAVASAAPFFTQQPFTGKPHCKSLRGRTPTALINHFATYVNSNPHLQYSFPKMTLSASATARLLSTSLSSFGAANSRPIYPERLPVIGLLEEPTATRTSSRSSSVLFHRTTSATPSS